MDGIRPEELWKSLTWDRGKDNRLPVVPARLFCPDARFDRYDNKRWISFGESPRTSRAAFVTDHDCYEHGWRSGDKTYPCNRDG